MMPDRVNQKTARSERPAPKLFSDRRLTAEDLTHRNALDHLHTLGRAEDWDRLHKAAVMRRGVFSVTGRGGTVLRPAVSFLYRQPNFPADAPLMIITDGWCGEEMLVVRDHCFVLPRKGWSEGAMPLRISAPVSWILKEEHYE